MKITNYEKQTTIIEHSFDVDIDDCEYTIIAKENYEDGTVTWDWSPTVPYSYEEVEELLLQRISSKDCSICNSRFNHDEGGMEGYVGLIPVALCPTCKTGMVEFASYETDQEVNLVKMLENFCAKNSIPHRSADELLADANNDFANGWLNCFLQCWDKVLHENS